MSEKMFNIIGFCFVVLLFYFVRMIVKWRIKKNSVILNEKFTLFKVTFNNHTNTPKELGDMKLNLDFPKYLCIAWSIFFVGLAGFTFVVFTGGNERAIYLKVAIIVVLLLLSLKYFVRSTQKATFYDNAFVYKNILKKEVCFYNEIECIEAFFTLTDSETLKNPASAEKGYFVRKNGKYVCGVTENVFKNCSLIENLFDEANQNVREIQYSTI